MDYIVFPPSSIYTQYPIMMEAAVFLGTFNAAECFYYLSPDVCLDTILSQSCKDNSFDLMAWFFL
jgi:hypothetical protein